jgi:NAD(P)-dependent dehydrogenase (short-subunit alcohol dehydrogenase family)
MLRMMMGDLVAVIHERGLPPGVLPLKSLCQPDDVAAAISFAVSSDARHMTGVDLLVDGGIHSGI